MGRRRKEDTPYPEASDGLASCLRQRRKALGWSQARLAQEAGVSYQAVRAVETNATLNPGVFTVLSMTDALGVSLEEAIAQARGGLGSS